MCKCQRLWWTYPNSHLNSAGIGSTFPMTLSDRLRVMHWLLRMFRLYLYSRVFRLVVLLYSKVLRKKRLCFLMETDPTTPRVTPLHKASQRTPHCRTAPLRQTRECGRQWQTAGTYTIPKRPYPTRRYEHDIHVGKFGSQVYQGLEFLKVQLLGYRAWWERLFLR